MGLPGSPWNIAENLTEEQEEFNSLEKVTKPQRNIFGGMHKIRSRPYIYKPYAKGDR